MTKRIIFFILAGFPMMVSAQSILDLGIFNNPGNSDRLEIRIKPTQTVSNDVYSAGIFTVRYLSSYGVTLSAPPGLNNPLFQYALVKQGTDALYSYYSFSFVNVNVVNWNVSTEYPIAILQINAGCGSGNGTFELINNTWTANNNGDYYQELDGIEAQNIFYQPSTLAPLGVGMIDMTPPTISCTGDKTVGTQPNVCWYTHVGASWDAIGSDNCPGFTIQYILSGATSDTLFTLDNALFNKGITTIKATITDVAGLKATCSFTVTINDTQKPMITAPAPITVTANAASCMATGVLLTQPVFSDNCPGAQVSNNAPLSFPKGSTQVTWTVTDAAGLTETATQTVTVQSSLAATAVKLSTSTICSGDTASLSFTLSGGFKPYTVVYSANGIPDTAKAYVSNKLIPVFPAASTRYRLVSITDSIGCAILPVLLTDSITARPKPTLSSLVPSEMQVCQGVGVSFSALGLLPNDTTTFNYTLTPGGPAVQSGISTAGGTYTFNPATNPIGIYGMSIQSITVKGCTSFFNTGNTGAYEVNPFPSFSGITSSADTVCLGSSVNFRANGLIPDVNVTIQYTLNGVPGSATVLSNSTGTANLLEAIYPEGTYALLITSIAVAGCSINSNQSAQFTVDPFNATCGFTVAGRLATETNKGVEEAKVSIGGVSVSVPFSFQYFTDTSGRYSFINTIPLAASYLISPFKNDNPLNGVTTFDLSLISKHILGIAPLNSPYKMIAADANKSNSITTFDIVELRKLILGIYQNLPNNTSWRFIDKAYVFPTLNNPFVPQFPENIAEPNLQMSALNEDFVALKVGDLNGTVVLSAQDIATERIPRETVWMDISGGTGMGYSEQVKAGETFELHFKPSTALAGYQFTLDLTDLEVLNITPDEGMGLQNFGVFEDAITCSYMSEKAGQTGTFSVAFRAKAAGQLSQMLEISSRITLSEAYSIQDEMAKMDLQARIVDISLDETSFRLYQNYPNPFNGYTVIPFYLPDTDLVRLTIYDALGAEVFTEEKRFDAGKHRFNLDGALLPSEGIFCYKVETSSASNVKKMLRN